MARRHACSRADRRLGRAVAIGTTVASCGFRALREEAEDDGAEDEGLGTERRERGGPSSDCGTAATAAAAGVLGLARCLPPSFPPLPVRPLPAADAGLSPSIVLPAPVFLSPAVTAITSSLQAPCPEPSAPTALTLATYGVPIASPSTRHSHTPRATVPFATGACQVAAATTGAEPKSAELPTETAANGANATMTSKPTAAAQQGGSFASDHCRTNRPLLPLLLPLPPSATMMPLRGAEVLHTDELEDGDEGSDEALRVQGGPGGARAVATANSGPQAPAPAVLTALQRSRYCWLGSRPETRAAQSLPVYASRQATVPETPGAALSSLSPVC